MTKKFCMWTETAGKMRWSDMNLNYPKTSQNSKLDSFRCSLCPTSALSSITPPHKIDNPFVSMALKTLWSSYSGKKKNRLFLNSLKHISHKHISFNNKCSCLVSCPRNTHTSCTVPEGLKKKSGFHFRYLLPRAELQSTISLQLYVWILLTFVFQSCFLDDSLKNLE